MKDIQKLKDLCALAVKRPDLNAEKMKDGSLKTKCNFGVQFIANGMGCYDLDDMVANAMVDKMRQLCGTSSWDAVSASGAVFHAAQGGLAIMGCYGAEHGHVAVVAPLPMQKSGSWDMEVPMLANVGKPPNGIKKASECFLLAQRPLIQCFVWGKNEESN